MTHDPVARRERVISSIQEFAHRCRHIDALVLTGSLARVDHPADALSDIDVEFILSAPADLGRDDRWLHQIGKLVTVQRFEPDDDQEWATRLAVYDDGTKVDFTLAGHERIASMVRERKLDDLYERGYRVLLDKTELTADLPVAGGTFPVTELPTAEEYRASVEEFWFEALHVPKYLARGELWLAKERDVTMKSLLLTMMEWHAIGSKPADTWYAGTRLREWTDPRTWDELQGTFGRFDPDDARRAFDATTTLYRRLARSVARTTGHAYPTEVEDAITGMFSKIQR